jgi:hypothetical protein
MAAAGKKNVVETPKDDVLPKRLAGAGKKSEQAGK